MVCLVFFLHGFRTEPEKHYALLRDHIHRIRNIPAYRFSDILVIVERNLGFEAEHIKRAAQSIEGVTFYFDDQSRRVGVLTTDKVKLGAMTLLNLMLRERRVHMLPDNELVSVDPKNARKRLREQLEIYSMQFKVPDTVFQRGRYALSGKVGGMKDDVVICLQLAVYWTETGRLMRKRRGPDPLDEAAKRYKAQEGYTVEDEIAAATGRHGD